MSIHLPVKGAHCQCLSPLGYDKGARELYEEEERLFRDKATRTLGKGGGGNDGPNDMRHGDKALCLDASHHRGGE